MTTLILGLIRVKVSAVFLEPVGVGIVSQVESFRNLIDRFVNLGVGSGVTKYVAEYSSKRDDQSLERLLQTVISAFLITGIIVFVVCLAFASRFAEWALADSSLGLLIVIVGVAAPLMAQVEVIFRCLQGMLKIREMVILGIIGSMLGLSITIPLIILAGVTGAILSIALSALLSLIVGQFYLRRVALREYHIHLRFIVPDKGMSIKLLRFGGMRSLELISTSLTLLAIRSMIIARLGAVSNGLYQVAFASSNQYLGLIAAALWTYGMPKVATMLDNPAGIDKMRNDALRLSFLVFTPLIVLILVLRNIWIPILYSSAFMGAYSLIGWQLVGDIFLVVVWAANISLVPREQFGFIIGATLGFCALRFGSFWLLLPLIGLHAAPVSYALAHGLMTPIILFVHYKYDRFFYSRRNWALIAKSIPVLGLTMILTFSPNANPVLKYPVPFAALGVWALAAVSREEAQMAMQIVRTMITRKRTKPEGD